jgi:hypothetical protein
MTPFMGQVSWTKKTSPGGKLTALVCHMTKKENIAEELTYLSTNIDLHKSILCKNTFLSFPLLHMAPMRRYTNFSKPVS